MPVVEDSRDRVWKRYGVGWLFHSLLLPFAPQRLLRAFRVVGHAVKCRDGTASRSSL